MKDRKPASKVRIAAPLILGVLSLLSFALYLYSANNAPYDYIDVIYLGPIFSLIGMVLSILTRKSRKTHPILWTSGLILNLFGFVICLLIIVLLAFLVMAMFNGTWP